MFASEFYGSIVEPNVTAFLADPTSERLAWNALVALLHFKDYWAAERRITVGIAKQELAAALPQFELVEDVGNALKHFKRSPGARAGLSAKHVRIASGAAFSDGSYYSDGTSHADAPDVVRLEFKGEIVDVANLCRSCSEFLRTLVVFIECDANEA